MNNVDFWNSILEVVANGFTSEGLTILDTYAEQFTNGQLVYQRFSPAEQHGCATGGSTHVIASLLAAAEIESDQLSAPVGSFQREQQCGAAQAARIEQWARKTGCWIDNVDEQLALTLGEQIAEGGEAHVYDHGATLVKSIGLDYYIQPILALDRISLHNTYFQETAMIVLGFGRDANNEFRIIVEQPYIQGERMTDEEIETFTVSLGFELKNKRNWTYATPSIYLSDMHDENVIRSTEGSVFVLDCDIRINTPELRQGGIRQMKTTIQLTQNINN